MAGQTRGTYRSKASGGIGIPAPPGINFAWLKEWFASYSAHRWPHANNESGKSRGQRKYEQKQGVNP